MTPLQEAETALREYKRSVDQGHPWVPGGMFKTNPGLDQHLLNAFEEFVRLRVVEEQAAPAKRVSLSDDPNWLPSSVAPPRPKKE